MKLELARFLDIVRYLRLHVKIDSISIEGREEDKLL